MNRPHAKHASLTDRVREVLADQPSLREVPMFGGVSFMVNERMVVAARDGGDLLVRADPKRNRELLTVPGACPAEMGKGRDMGRAGSASITTPKRLAFWIDVALDFNTRAPRHRR